MLLARSRRLLSCARVRENAREPACSSHAARGAVVALLIIATLLQLASLQRKDENLFGMLPNLAFTATRGGMPFENLPGEERHKARPDTPQQRNALRRVRVTTVAAAVPLPRPQRPTEQCRTRRVPAPECSPHAGRAPPAARHG